MAAFRKLTVALIAAGTLVAGTATSANANIYQTDGYWRIWGGTYGSGDMCASQGNMPDLYYCPGNVGIGALGSVENDGYVGGNDRVNLYANTSYNGAWACIGPGDEWMDRSLGIETFNLWGGAGVGRPHPRPGASNPQSRLHRWIR